MIANVDLPPELRVYVLDYQNSAKKAKDRNQYSIATSIIGIIQEHKDQLEEIKALKEEIEVWKDMIAELKKALQAKENPEET